MLTSLLQATSASDKGAIARPDLAVLRGTTMKSLLIETGFMTNEQEAEKLLQTTYQQKIATAVTKAVDGYVQTKLLPIKK